MSIVIGLLVLFNTLAALSGSLRNKINKLALIRKFTRFLFLFQSLGGFGQGE